MVCCAFAVLVLSQLLAPFVWARRRFFGDPTLPNVAVAWSLADGTLDIPSLPPAKRRPLRLAFYVAVVVEFAAAAGVLAYVAPNDDGGWVEATAFDGAWCRGAWSGIEGGIDGYFTR